MGGHSDFVVVLVFFVSLAIYFLPAIIASSKRHPKSIPIFALNLLLGWTLLGWVAAMVWSLIDAPRTSTSQSLSSIDNVGRLEKLASLREKGLLTQAEFESEKSKILQS